MPEPMNEAQFERLIAELTGIRRALQGLAVLFPIAVVVLLAKG